MCTPSASGCAGGLGGGLSAKMRISLKSKAVREEGAGSARLADAACGAGGVFAWRVVDIFGDRSLVAIELSFGDKKARRLAPIARPCQAHRCMIPPGSARRATPTDGAGR